MEEITAELAKSVVKTGFNDLPEPVVHATKRVLLDSIGCGLGGYVTDRAKIALELVAELGGKPQASIIGGGRTSYALASFVNGELINALDFDAGGPQIGHVVPYVIPPALAMGERMNVSGKDLITAIALALEVGGRVGSSLAPLMLPKTEAPYYDWSMFSFAYTIFGGVAGASKLLGLDEERVANAFGIAGASTPVPAQVKWQHIAGPVIMTKYNCWAGWVAQLATFSALAAEKGFTGDTTILDGEWGFWKIVGSPFFKAENVTGGLGKIWHIEEVLDGEAYTGVTFKEYPTCGCQHAFIPVISRIIDEEGVKPEDIEEVTIGCEPHTLSPLFLGGVSGFADTQFSLAYSVAVAAYYGDKAEPFWQLPSTFNDPRIKELMNKVKITLHPRAEELLAGKIKAGRSPRFRNVSVEITAKGRKFTSEAAAARTMLKPVSDEELKAKFRNNAAYSPLKTGKVKESLGMLYELEEVDDVTRLFELLTVG